MRVCMLAEKLPPEFTGSGKQALFLGKALTAKNVDIVGICSNPNGKSAMDLTWGFPIFRLGTSYQEFLGSLQFAVKSTIWLLKNKKHYDMLHVHGYCLAAITSLAISRLLGKKTIYKITLPGEDDPNAIYKSRFGRIKNLLISKFDAFVAVSERVRKATEEFEYPITKVYTVSNGVDERFRSDKVVGKEARENVLKKYGLDQNCKIVLFMGSIEYRKGVDILARAWPHIISEIPESRLLLVGPFFKGIEFQQRVVNQLDDYLGKTVFMVGNVEDPEFYYHASDVFVFPSRNESFGNVLVEAMACGRACVATRIEGVTDDILVDGYNGFIVEQEDDDALTKAIIAILRDRKLKHYLGENALRTVDEKFRMETIAEGYMDLYETLLFGDCGSS
jgi:glycosyltransferase involved in cell wall biosynthesis